MKWTPWILPLLLVCSLGAVYVLPQAGDTAQSAVIMELPAAMSGWQFEKIAASEAELGTLDKETEFAKAICLSARPGERNLDGLAVPDRLDLSVVLSGSDLNNSIHRPERCMPAQGHNILSSTSVPVTLPNGRTFQTKRLNSVQSLPGKDGKTPLEFKCVSYYFFVGHDRITNDHFERTLIDMKDRLLRGMDQRWAYVSVSMWYGRMPWIEPEVPEAEADEKLLAYIKDLATKQIRWEQVRK